MATIIDAATIAGNSHCLEMQSCLDFCFSLSIGIGEPLNSSLFASVSVKSSTEGHKTLISTGCGTCMNDTEALKRVGTKELIYMTLSATIGFNP
jgi:hypothetical protein